MNSVEKTNILKHLIKLKSHDISDRYLFSVLPDSNSTLPIIRSKWEEIAYTMEYVNWQLDHNIDKTNDLGLMCDFFGTSFNYVACEQNNRSRAKDIFCI